MLSPVIHLRKRGLEPEKEESCPVIAGTVPQNSTSRLGISAVVLFGLFMIIFSSTLFLVKGNGEGNGVFAEGLGKRNVASLTGAFLGKEEENEQEKEIPIEVILYKDPFENITVHAKAAYVFDVASGKVLYEKNKNTPLPLASLTKVMTALTAKKALGEDSVVTIEVSDLDTEGSSGFTEGERWRFKKLLDFTLTTSSNDGATAIARTAGVAYAKQATSTTQAVSSKTLFVQKMNELGREINMESSTFYNETGLDVTDTKNGGEGTAHDIASLYAYILTTEPDFFEATKRSSFEITSMDNIVHSAKNTNQFVSSFSGIIGSKTGYTDLAGGNLAVAFDSGLGTPIIVVVLGSTTEGRFSDVEKLSLAAQDAVSQGAF